MAKRLAMLVLLYCILVTTGCAGLMSTPEPVTLSFFVPDWFDQGQWAQWAMEFQETYPHITVEIKNGNEYNERSLTDTDALLVDQGTAVTLIHQQAVMDLSTMMMETEELNLAEFYTGLTDMFRYEGKLYGLPVSVDVLVIYYNRDLFDANLAAYPTVDWTWQEFLEAGLAVSDPEQEIYGYAISYQGQLGVMEPAIWIYQHGGQLFDNWMAPQEIILDTEANIEAMEFYASLIHDYHIAPTYAEGPQLRPSSYPWSRILQGNYGMWIGNLAQRGGIGWPEEWDFNWGVVPMPHDKVPFVIAPVTGAMITATSEHPDEAWLWAQFLTTKYPVGQMPVRRPMVESSTIEETFGVDVAEAARAALDDAVFINPDMRAVESQMVILATTFDAIRKGTADPATALAEGQRALDQ